MVQFYLVLGKSHTMFKPEFPAQDTTTRDTLLALDLDVCAQLLSAASPQLEYFFGQGT
ncbi:hypothetical protein EUX98_g3915 [Antrodiella citrinella]|uniref:Uncharacterized protein n=1 Tax=Antrodiella citrinella TaxID=2447956 RepID=A0A4S4MXS2_9APHY|nr:hypothetical protein EUX98_g3915 [Antrodiella citrinella]